MNAAERSLTFSRMRLSSQSRERSRAPTLRLPLPHRADDRGVPVRRIPIYAAVATGHHPMSSAPSQAQRLAPRDPARGRPGRRTFTAPVRDLSSTCRSKADGPRVGWSSAIAKHDPSKSAARRLRPSPRREPRSQRRGLQTGGPHSREAACTENGSRKSQ